MTRVEPPPEPAVVFVPPTEGHLDPRYVSLCMEYCTRKGYTFEGIIRTYKAGMQMLADGTAKVIVAARRDHIDPDDLPRVEFVGEDTRRPTSRPQARPGATAPPTPDAGRDRRPRKLRRE
jgi:hypothetical protein